MANAPGGIYRIRNLSATICGVLCQGHAGNANTNGVCWQGDYKSVICMVFPHIHILYETERAAACS